MGVSVRIRTILSSERTIEEAASLPTEEETIQPFEIGQGRGLRAQSFPPSRRWEESERWNYREGRVEEGARESLAAFSRLLHG